MLQWSYTVRRATRLRSDSMISFILSHLYLIFISGNIKYFIKDIVVEYLSPLMTDCKSKNDVIKVINDNLHSTKDLIDNVLKENGFEYKSSIEINNEFFPTRTYEDVTLYADYYDALIIKLGTGEGDNWWCVMYPNLCFDEIENVVYKSKIVEIIKKIKG